MKLSLTLSMFLSFSVIAGENSMFDSDSISDIQIIPNAGLEFKSEKAHLSPTVVTIDYEFNNPGQTPISTEIIFKIPSISPNGYLNQLNTANFKFEALVQGKPIPYPIRMRAFLKDKEITNQLSELKITYLDYYPQGNPASIKEALKRGFVEERIELADFEDEKSPMVTVVYPLFNPEASYSWKQIFSPGLTKIKIKYTPKTGSEEGSISEPERWDGHLPDYIRRDQHMGERAQEKNESLRMTQYLELYGTYFKFTLPDSTTWPKGIEKFHLEADGGQVILLDMNGELKSDLESLIYKKENFKPQGKMKVQYLGKKQGPLHKDIFFTKKINGPANCRLKPNAKILISIPDQEAVFVRERQKNWYKISFKGTDCWTNETNLIK